MRYLFFDKNITDNYSNLKGFRILNEEVLNVEKVKILFEELSESLSYSPRINVDTDLKIVSESDSLVVSVCQYIKDTYKISHIML